MPERTPKTLEKTTRYDPAEVEGADLRRWMAGGYFHPPAEGTAAENFSVAIPPPNVTGALHMGHALNGSIQDALVRMQRMRGRNTLWILGTDHAGSRPRRWSKRSCARRGPRATSSGARSSCERVWEWKEQYGSQIVEQYKRLGASCDYERERFTLDEGYVRAVYRVFTALYEQGLHLPRQLHGQLGPGLALGDLRPRGREPRGHRHALRDRLPARGRRRARSPSPRCARRRCSPTPRSRCNPKDDRYRDLVGRTAILPLVGRRLPIIADDYVDPEFGTGALKITPGHDPNDFEIGRAHGLEEMTVIGEDGRMTEQAGERFAGLTVEEAQEAVVAALREEGLIRSEEPYDALGPLLAPLRRADRAADLAAVVLPHGRAGGAGDRGGRAR